MDGKIKRIQIDGCLLNVDGNIIYDAISFVMIVILYDNKWRLYTKEFQNLMILSYSFHRDP